MPPKEIPTGNLYLSAGGELKPLAHITELTEVPEMVVPDGQSEEEMLKFQFLQEMTITVNISHKPYWLLAMFGDTKSIPNNWLRMHGYPMRRKRKGTRKKK